MIWWYADCCRLVYGWHSSSRRERRTFFIFRRIKCASTKISNLFMICFRYEMQKIGVRWSCVGNKCRRSTWLPQIGMKVFYSVDRRSIGFITFELMIPVNLIAKYEKIDYAIRVFSFHFHTNEIPMQSRKTRKLCIQNWLGCLIDHQVQFVSINRDHAKVTRNQRVFYLQPIDWINQSK